MVSKEVDDHDETGGVLLRRIPAGPMREGDLEARPLVMLPFTKFSLAL
jgi:hypothetical protein